MKAQFRSSLSLLLLLALAGRADAAVRYVNVSNSTPASPYTSWADAATTIQAAINAASPGDQILVTNGVYQTGGTVVASLTNRVAITKAVTVQSVNGPDVTIILGYKVPGTTHGNSAVRCVYLTNGASLIGFTLTNGATQAYGIGENGGGGAVGGSGSTVVLSNCVVTGNASSSSGGGVSGCVLNNCVITRCSSYLGGGAGDSMLNNCVLTGNFATNSGAGGFACTFNNCRLTGNTAIWGGGAYSSTLNSCEVDSNVATQGGGGIMESTANNSTIVANTVSYDSIGGGGGASGGTLNNCIVYYNNILAGSGPNYLGSTLNYSCTTPLPTNGVGNLTVEPKLSSLTHLSSASPLISAGSAAFTSGTDIDGEAWANPPSIGCDQFNPGALTGSLNAGVRVDNTNVGTAFNVNFLGETTGRTGRSEWDFGDGNVATNQAVVAHAWASPGDYTVALRAYNDSNPSGVTTSIVVHVAGPHYVSASSATPVAPFNSWATAAARIQDAVDVAYPGGTILVTNGAYDTGGYVLHHRVKSRVAVLKPLRIKSVNGPDVTSIVGEWSTWGTRCAYLTNGALLSGFTLTGGVTQGTETAYDRTGGGARCEPASVISNCFLTGNQVNSYGGGVWGGTLVHCTLTGNSAGSLGGGAYGSTLVNCAVTGNSATFGGGIIWSTVRNSIVYFNGGLSDANYLNSTLTHSCSTPLASGAGNISDDPLFVNQGGGDLRLQSNSPCINSGNNSFVSSTTDLDGNPRVVGGTVDQGPYEFQSPTSVISYAWLQRYGLPTDGSVDYTDSDGDGAPAWHEWHANTIPTNVLSVLKFVSATRSLSGVTVTWQSATNVTYFLQRSTNISGPLFFGVRSNIAGYAGATTFTDTNTAGAGRFFYRVGVQ